MSKIRSLYVEPLHTSLHLSSAILPLQTALPHFGVNLTESFHKVELQAPLLPQYCMNQYFLNFQIFFHSFAHLFPFSELYTTSSSLPPIFIPDVLFISTVSNSETFDLKER